MMTNVPKRLSSEGEFSVYLLNTLSRDLSWPEVLDTLGTRLVSAVPGATTILSSNRANIGFPCVTTGQPCPSDEPTMGSSHPITTATWNNSRSNDHSPSSRDSDKQNSHEQELCAHNNSGHTTPGDLVSPTTIPPTLDPHKVLSTSQPELTSQRQSPSPLTAQQANPASLPDEHVMAKCVVDVAERYQTQPANFPLPPTITSNNTVPNQDTVNHPAQTAAVSHNHDDTSTLNGLRQEHESIPCDTQSTPPEEGVDEPVHPPSTEKPLTMETLAIIKTIVQHMTINIIKIIDKIQKKLSYMKHLLNNNKQC